MTLAKAVSCIIYLDGQDTGLRAYTRNEAVEILHRVLRRRGDYRITKDDLLASYVKSPGRASFSRPKLSTSP